MTKFDTTHTTKPYPPQSIKVGNWFACPHSIEDPDYWYVLGQTNNGYTLMGVVDGGSHCGEYDSLQDAVDRIRTEIAEGDLIPVSKATIQIETHA